MTYDFDTRTVSDLIAQGSHKWSAFGDAIAMWVAEMDLGIAPEIRDYLVNAAQRGALGYLPPREIPGIMNAVSDWLGQFGPAPDPERMFLIPEVLSALRITITQFTAPDAPVIVPTPAYMPFLTLPGEYGREVRQVPSIFRAGRWELDLEALEAALTPGSLLILCNPWNPAGRCLSGAELDALAAVVERRGARVFEDCIHAPVLIDGTYVPYGPRSAATRAHTITATSATKGWNIPGLKAAQLIFYNDDDAARYAPHANAWSSPTSTLGARATKIAFTEGRDWNRAVCSYIGETLRIVEERVQAWPGVRMAHVEGTYIAFLDFSEAEFVRAEKERARREGREPKGAVAAILEQAQVALTPGRASGAGFEQWARMVLATPRAIALEALDRIEGLLDSSCSQSSTRLRGAGR